MKIKLIGALLCGGLLIAAPAAGSAQSNPAGGSQVDEESGPGKTPERIYKSWRSRRLLRMQKQKSKK